MTEQTIDISDYLGALKRRRTAILAIAVTIFAIGALAAFLWPPTYRSSATILIKEQDIPPDLVRSTVTSYASRRIQAISQRVMARANLLEIINEYGLYETDRKRLTTEELVVEMRNNIGLDMIDAAVVDPRSGRPTAATIAFQLSFSGEHPAQVQKVANELMSLYLKENLRERSQQASETVSFLSDEAERLDREIAKLEENLATFKKEHSNSLPGMSELNLKVMERSENEISDIDSRIQALEERKIYLESQLSQLKPYGDNVNLDPSARLQALRTSYLGLIARYSEDHPDVIRLKREIEGLEQEVGAVDTSGEQLARLDQLRAELATLRKRYSNEHPDVVKLQQQIEALETAAPRNTGKSALSKSASQNPDNPAYVQLQTQIEAANLEIRSLRDKQENLRAKISDYERRIAQGPQLEWE